MVINLPKWPITSHLHWTQKKTTTSDVGPDLERAQKCDGVELVNGTQTPLLITGSPTEIYIHVYTNDIKKNSTDSLPLKDHIPSQKWMTTEKCCRFNECYGNIL